MRETLMFWGTRGSIPTPGADTARYGGNTPCVAVTRRPDRLLILDAGSGIRPLGHALMQHQNGGLHADILLSHTHWDHIQGLPFFKPLARRANSIAIYGAPQESPQGRVALEEILDRQMDPMVFPVPLRSLGASIHITEIGEQELEVDGFHVRSFRLRHPGVTLGYRLTPRSGAREVAYTTDNELGPGGAYPLPADWRARLAEALAGVDTLIHDAMYSDAMIDARGGWGHSTPRQAVELAAECGARRLVLFHHEPEHDDAMMDALLADARAHARAVCPALTVDAAVEGMTIEL
ncbi:MAG TPA: MBL fold metallo-hydrolase [Gemmatimonadales bacterium]|nr:MBL fold metallo-hydrolase [Gemmatimonadales bacterium]